MIDIVCNVCCYTAECYYDGQPMCYVCRENSAKEKKEMENDTNVDCECNADKACDPCIDGGLYKGVPVHSNDNYPEDDNMTDAEADADTLRSCGWGTDEDYGYFGDE